VERHGATVTLRDTRGTDIDAACGQLRVTSEIRTRRPVLAVDEDR
jgi:adenine C2-methylase RlmN of 23S rRNA A2503 and tRNA A37